MVCTANVCRSPMAEALWREAAKGRRRPLPVTSAGVDAEPGREADATCVELMAAKGIDISGHQAQRFNADRAWDCELILVMEPEHQRRIQQTAPELAGRVQLLGRWGAGPIADPYRQAREQYEECVGQLEQAIAGWMKKIP
ncbi:MAG: low molecular weight protein-tyrosine-phosphatase [Steroidobacteraceae bacterium]